MRGGDLRHRIELQSNTPTRDAYGAGIAAWTTYATVWAAKYDMNGSEQNAGEQALSELTTAFVIRYRTDVSIKPYHRVLWGTRVYEINAVLDEPGKKESLRLACREVAV